MAVQDLDVQFQSGFDRPGSTATEAVGLASATDRLRARLATVMDVGFSFEFDRSGSAAASSARLACAVRARARLAPVVDTQFTSVHTCSSHHHTVQAVGLAVACKS